MAFGRGIRQQSFQSPLSPALTYRFIRATLSFERSAMLSSPRAVLMAVLVALCPVPAGAEEPEIDCATASATSELNSCAEKALEKADGELDIAYQKVVAFIAKNGGDKPYDSKSWEEALRASQRAWLAYRDADCKGLVPMAWSGGSATSGEVLGCMTGMTAARTKELISRYLDE